MPGAKPKKKKPKLSSIENSIKTMAKATEKISQTNENILAVQKEFNDNFILHRSESEAKFDAVCKEMTANVEALKGVQGEVGNLRTDFNVWFYPLMTSLLKKTVYTAMSVIVAALGLKAFGLW